MKRVACNLNLKPGAYGKSKETRCSFKNQYMKIA
jgi:hypothetical protein